MPASRPPKKAAPMPASAPMGAAALVLDQRTLMATVREMRKREMSVETAETMSLGGGFNPMAGVTPETMRQQWGIGLMGMPQRQAIFTRARELYATNDFVGSVVETKADLCNDGMRINGVDPNGPPPDGRQAAGPEEAEAQAVRQWIAESGLDFSKLARDIFLERVLCDNAILFWKDADRDGKLPRPTVLNCEEVTLRNAWGKEWLMVTMRTQALSQEDRERLGPRYADAMTGKTLTVVNGEQGEYFRYLTGEKNGNGMKLPSIYQIFMDLGIRDNLRMGDWNGAWLMRTIIRLVRRGHDIRQGPLAGQDIHFLKDKQAKKIKKGLMQNIGSFDMVTNFDLNISYSHLEASFFDPAKAEGTNARLESWVGPMLALMRGEQLTPDNVQLVQTRVDAIRGEVRRLLNRLLNDAEFYGSQKPPVPIQVTWSQDTLTNGKMQLEKTRLAQAAGLASTRTAREGMGFDHGQESARLKAEHEDPLSVRPAFEQKQGMGKGAGPAGGRPPGENPPPPTP